MRRYLHTFLKWLPTLIPGAVMTLGTVPLSDVGTTLSGNLQYLGIDPPEALKTVTANYAFTVGGAVALIAYILLLLWSGRKKTEPAVDTSIDFGGYSRNIAYRVGSLVEGIEWKQGYTHIELAVCNNTSVVFEDLSIVFIPEHPIVAATVKSRFADARIGLIIEFRGPTMVYVDRDGNEHIDPYEEHEDDLMIGPPYRLVCARLPAGVSLAVNLATVVMAKDVMSSEMWSREAVSPRYIDIHSSYRANGVPVEDQRRLEFDLA